MDKNIGISSFNYSVVIRTLGNTGEKYLTLLHAIDNQTVKPHEIIVAIPDGYSLDHMLGNERVIRSGKGMVTQRGAGINAATSDYLLVLDDDLDFPPDFAEKMHRHLQANNLDCTLSFPTIGGCDSPPSLTVSRWKSLIAKAKQIRGAFTGQVFYSHRRTEWFDVITSTAGHRTYINCADKLCQAGAGGCCFIKKSAAKAIEFDKEIWLDHGRLSSYASYEDAVFYYKLFLHGGRIAYTPDTNYTHLDAAAGRPAKSKLDSKRIRLYTIARNRTLFWLLHIWPSRRNIKTLFGGIYALTNYTLYNLVINIHPKYWPAIAALFLGYYDAFHYYRNK